MNIKLRKVTPKTALYYKSRLCLMKKSTVTVKPRSKITIITASHAGASQPSLNFQALTLLFGSMMATAVIIWLTLL